MNQETTDCYCLNVVRSSHPRVRVGVPILPTLPTMQVPDENSGYAIPVLRERGLDVTRVVTVADEPETRWGQHTIALSLSHTHTHTRTHALSLSHTHTPS